VLALQHRVIPPHLHLREANPHIPWDELPVVIPTERLPWPKRERPRLAGVSAFGMSGTNVHVVLEEAPEVAAASPAGASEESPLERPLHLLCLSAKNEAALQELAERYQDHLASHPDDAAADICFTANAGRDHFSDRIGVVAGSTAQLHERLTAYLAAGECAGLLSGRVTVGKPPQLAFLFTGQGSQYAGMGRELYLTSPAFRSSLEHCDQILAPLLDRPLLSLLFPEDPDQAHWLDQTVYTQPALFAFEYSLAQLWFSWGLRPSALLGHSIGEYVAACLAGVFSLEQGLSLVAARGRLMQRLPGEGAMAAVFAAATEVEAALAPWGGAVAVAADNGPRHTVVAGEARFVAEACATLGERGLRTRPLRVAQAFHSPLLEPMLGEFAELAARISYRAPQLPVISNLSGEVAGDEMAGADYWVRQARQRVRFGAGVASLAERGVGVCLEVGPQPTLSRLASESAEARAAGVEFLASLDRQGRDWEQMLGALSGLYLRGAEVDWAGFEVGYRRRRVALPTYPFQRERYWVSGGRVAAEPRPRAASPAAGTHPLLGGRVAEAWAEGARFEIGLSAAQPSYLSEHRVFGAAVVPAAAYLEMMRAAAGDLARGGAVELEGASFRRALVLAEGREQRLQVVARPGASGICEVRIYSASGEEVEPTWVLHATASALAAGHEEPVAPLDLGALRVRCPQEISAEELYESYRGQGLDYGPSFRPIQSLWRGEGEALALLRLPEGLEGEAARYGLHPALLDGGFQTLGAVFHMDGDRGGAGGDETYLPVGLRGLKVYEPPGRVLWCHARAAGEGGGRTESAELRLISPEGRLVAAAEGLEMRRASREAVLQQAQEPAENWLYEVVWREQAVTPRVAGGGGKGWLILTDGEGVGEELAARLRAGGEAVKVAWAGREWRELSADACELDAESAADYEQLLRWAEGDEGRLGGVVYFGALGAGEQGSEEGAGEPAGGAGPWEMKMGRRLGRACRTTLSLAQSLAGLPRAPRLWLVTGGAQAAGGSVTAEGLAQTPVWGLGKAIALEQPELKCTLLDLGPGPVAEAAATIFAEIVSGGEERQVAYRESRRYVARLARDGRGGTGDGARLRLPAREPFELRPAKGGEIGGPARSKSRSGP
jgi:acyl transferase domain-containing protein